MKTTLIGAIALAATVALAAPVFAQGSGAGPVGTACKADIAKLCAEKAHGQGAVRACLESNKAKVSAACATALDSTGPGRNR